MILQLLILFMALVTYQTVAKSYRLPLLSLGLIILKDKAIIFFEWFGEHVGYYLNIYEWVTKFFQRLWELVERLWGNIRPFFESILEIAQPVWQLLFSWVYFFVGFAKNKYVIFSYVGGCITFLGIVFFYPEWYYSHSSSTLIIIFFPILVGTVIAYPDILPKLFPNFIPNMVAFYNWMDNPRANMRVRLPDLNEGNDGEPNIREYDFNDLMRLTMANLKVHLREKNLPLNGSKVELSRRLLDNAGLFV